MSQIDKLIYLPLLLWFILFMIVLYFIIFSSFLSMFLSINKGRVIYIKSLINKCNKKMKRIVFILKFNNILFIINNISKNLLNKKI